MSIIQLNYNLSNNWVIIIIQFKYCSTMYNVHYVQMKLRKYNDINLNMLYNIVENMLVYINYTFKLIYYYLFIFIYNLTNLYNFYIQYNFLVTYFLTFVISDFLDFLFYQ